ncbi:MAG: zinc-ribbon domain-containing protein [Ruminococcus sp.]|nr:zinc-ribbon domain-containing protein [Ruminococcus sp.]
MFCSKCGTQNADGAAFCKSCGTRLMQIERNETVNTVRGGGHCQHSTEITFKF